MAGYFKVTLAYALVLAAIGLPTLLKVWLLPSWRDLPQPDTFSLFMVLEDTEYAPDFTESRFSKLQIGMSKDNVMSALGEPIGIARRSKDRVMEMTEWEPGSWRTTYRAPDLNDAEELYSETYYYSRSGDSSDHWYVRAVTFSSDGRVIRIRRIFYED